MTSRGSKNSTRQHSDKAILDALYPSLRDWFLRTYPSGFSEIQMRALPQTLAGSNTLILAPTGSGKTLAAFLSVLSRLAFAASSRTLPNAVCAIYVSPLKALDNDIHRNLAPALDAVNASVPAAAQIRMDVRTGDTEGNQRGRQNRKRPHLLLTTPETLSTMLSQAAWRDAGFATETVIVDEIHSFCEGKRGSLLALALERLQHRSESGKLQRIGVSATAWPAEAIATLLCGPRECALARVDVKKATALTVVAPERGIALPPAGHNPFRIASTVAKLVEQNRCSLIFLTTRSGVERLALALKVLLPDLDDKIAVHHGSVNREERQKIEEGLKEGFYRAVVASSSLELGVDFACVDRVILVGTPRGVSRALQRLGRSGHRVNGVAQGTLVPMSLPDLIECVALRGAASEGRLDALRIPGLPLDVLAQVLLGMSIERPWSLDEAYDLVRKAGPYLSLSRQDFDDVVEYLAGGGRVLGGYRTYGKIVIENGVFRVADRKTARQFYMNAGVISADYEMKVVSVRNRSLGSIEEGFITSLQPNEAFIMGGKPVKVKYTFQNTAVVEPAKGEIVKTPRWMGNKMALTAQLAQEELRLRRDLRDAWESAGEKECEQMLLRQYEVDKNVARRVAVFVSRQYEATPLPTDSPVIVERIVSGRTLLISVHVIAGRAVNRSLAWVAGSRLAHGGSVVANFDDHSFMLSLDAREVVDEKQLRKAFDPHNWIEDLRKAVSTTETLGRSFRHIAEIGQLLPRRTLHGTVSTKSASWSGTLLYKTLLEHEPGHPLLREAVREVMEDQCDAPRAYTETARIFDTPIEIYDLPRPSPLGLPLFAAFNREVLVAADPERALDDLLATLYDQWAPA